MSTESIIEALKSASIQIRDERRTGANTANRVGSLFLALCERLAEVLDLADKLKGLDDKYLRKDQPDSTQYLIQFFAGLEAGLYAAGGKDGSKLHPDGLAELGRLQVNGDSEFRGNLSSKDFVSGFMTGKGWAMQLKKYINAAGVEETRAVGELDDLIVRGTLRVFEFVVSQMLGENDNRVFTAMLEVDHYDPATGKVWLNTQNGKLYNPFRIDDCIVVQQYNGMPSEDNGYYITKQYELVITGVGVGDMSLGEDRLDWVTFKNFTTTMEGGDVSLIAKGDTFVRWDNLSDPTRKGIIQMMTVGESTPYMDIAYGLKTDPDNAHKGRVGNLEGIYHHLFGWLQSFGAYLINLYAVGDFRLRRTGESLDSRLEMLSGLFATNFSKLTYEITEEDNYLKNASFTENLDGWSTDASDAHYISSNDEPFLVNGSLMAIAEKVAAIEECEGRNRLHLHNASITQSNSLIRKPGTHKVYVTSESATSDDYTEEPDKLYLSIKFLPVSSGTLTLGFVGASSDAGSLPFISRGVERSNDWQTVQVSGTWDGVGNFVLSYTGNMYVSLLSLTADPLSDFKSEVSTSIEQTATNIRLLGTNINNVKGTVTQLAIDLDAAEERITIYANKVDNIEGSVTDLGLRIDAAESDITLYATQVNDHAARLKSLDTQVSSLNSGIDAAASAVSDLEKYVDGAFADGIITGAEATAIEKYINTVENTKASVDATYSKLYANVYLSGSPKTALQTAKSNFDSAVANLLSSINTAIADGQATAAEKTGVDTSFDAYNTRLSEFETAVEAAYKAIQDTLKGFSDTNTASISELRVDVTSISSAVATVEGDLATAKARIETVAGIAESAGDAEVYNQSSNPWNSWPSGTEYKHVGALWYCTSSSSGAFEYGHTYRYIGYNNTNSWEDVTDSQESASYVLQNKDKISTVVASFDADGNLTNTSGLVTTSYASSVYATQTTVDNLSGRVSTAEAQIDVHSTQISMRVEKDGIISAINQSSESITIDASKINLNGNVIISGILKGDFEYVSAYKMNHVNYDGYWYICNSYSTVHSNSVYLARNTSQDFSGCLPSYCHLPTTAYGAEFFVYNANNYAKVHLYGVTVLAGSNSVAAKSAVRCKCVGYGSTTLGYIFEPVTTS